jgi:hypothetical protein
MKPPPHPVVGTDGRTYVAPAEIAGISAATQHERYTILVDCVRAMQDLRRRHPLAAKKLQRLYRLGYVTGAGRFTAKGHALLENWTRVDLDRHGNLIFNPRRSYI